jgi:hypothetical protein
MVEGHHSIQSSKANCQLRNELHGIIALLIGLTEPNKHTPRLFIDITHDWNLFIFLLIVGLIDTYLIYP